ncbi:MAG TPA: Uma2 family endonuclease [Abditibacteriaceae bacterium]|jgi:Uma2 family endonuclease|nr:Uma2 family endonuclease [Abditibacteriaceae bacterium]
MTMLERTHEIVQSERIKVWTYDDYAQLPSHGSDRLEVIEGELHLSPAPNIRHQNISGNLFGILRNHILQNRLGQVFSAPVDVVFSPTNTFQPDIVFVSTENKGIITAANIQGAPDLLVEIISPSSDRLDRIRKPQVYAQFGVAHFWIVDPVLDLVEEYVLSGATYRLVCERNRRETWTPRLFPTLNIILEEIFQTP